VVETWLALSQRSENDAGIGQVDEMMRVALHTLAATVVAGKEPDFADAQSIFHVQETGSGDVAVNAHTFGRGW
jgi:hypothetical protein